MMEDRAFRLDQDQENAIHDFEGAHVVFAGAGSGKTRAMTERVARMIEGGIDPKNIAMLTFSRKATREMWGRLAWRLNSKENMPIIENFHSFGWKLIQANPLRYGMKEGVSLIDESDQEKKVRECMKACHIDFKTMKTKHFDEMQEFIANEGLSLSVQEHRQRIADHVYSVLSKSNLPDAYHKASMDALLMYEQKKKALNLVDFGDLISLPVRLIEQDARFAESLGRRFRYVLVDEFQDTNVSQYKLLRAIASQGNLFAVGDSNQCIYEWRGAQPSYMQQTVNDLGASVHYLLGNYRSIPSVVDCATQLIGTQAYGEGNKPHSMRDQQDLSPKAYLMDTDRELSNLACSHIEHFLKQGLEPADIAVLYRNNAMARIIEPQLASMNVPYHVTQGLDLFSRVEAQLLIAAVRLVINPRDVPAFEKLADYLADGLGKKGFEKIESAVLRDGVTIREAIGTSLTGRGLEAALSVMDRIDGLASLSPRHLFNWALDYASPTGGNFPYIIGQLSKTADNPEEAVKRRFSLLSLIQDSIDMRMDRLGDSSTLARQWHEVSDMGLSLPDEENIDSNKITLSTLHKSKGLEWPVVIVIGASIKEDMNPDDLSDEDRRLMYVGFTRAKEHLVVMHANRVFNGYEVNEYLPSPFIAQSGMDVIDQRYGARAESSPGF